MCIAYRTHVVFFLQKICMERGVCSRLYKESIIALSSLLLKMRVLPTATKSPAVQ